MILIERLAVDAVVGVQIPYHPGDALVKSRILLGWDHLQLISGTNVISEAAPEI